MRAATLKASIVMVGALGVLPASQIAQARGLRSMASGLEARVRQVEFDAFYRQLSTADRNDPRARETIELIHDIMLGKGSKRSIYVVYYDASRSRAGFSHGALWANGQSWETRPHPKPGESYFMRRSVAAALEAQRAADGERPAVLPTAIIEIPNVSPAQRRKITMTFQRIGRYSFLNGGGRSAQAAHCMGLVYHALRSALPLPTLKRRQILPVTLARVIRDHVPNARTVGRLAGWLGQFRLPHINRVTFIGLRKLSAEQLQRTFRRALPPAGAKRQMSHPRTR